MVLFRKMLIKLAVIGALATLAYAAPPSCITVADNYVINADLTPYTGIISANLMYVAQNGVANVRQSVVTINVLAGVMSKCLTPAVYQMTNLPQGYKTFWVIPPTGGPFTIQQVESQAPLQPGARYSVTQMLAGNEGDCIQTIGGFPIWSTNCGMPLKPSTKSYLLESVNGVLGWGLAGGHVHSSYIGHKTISQLGHVIISEIGN